MMEKRLICIFLIACFISGCATPARVKKSRTHHEEEGKIVLAADVEIEPPRKRLDIGERLEYRIAWLGVPVGTITSHVKGIADINGREAYHIELTARTNAFCSAIYRIDDKFVTYMDTGTLLPLRHELRRREGRHRKDYIVEYDHKNNTAAYHNLIENRTSLMDVPEGVHDPLSAIYFFRMQDVKVGSSVNMVVNMNENNYNILGRIEKKTIIDVPSMGTFDAFESSPIAELDGKPVEKGRAWAYVSCDESRIPLFGVVDVWVRLIGRVSLTLTKIEYAAS